MTLRPVVVFAALLVAFPGARLAANEAAAARSIEGLQVLYDFSEGEGGVVRDRSGLDGPLDLEIADPQAVRWEDGSLQLVKAAKIRGRQPARRLAEAIEKSRAITLEAWIRPANTTQEGPARIVTLSQNSSHRNFTLGQEGDRYQARLRTTRSGTNGSGPAFDAPGNSAATRLSHVVYTRQRSGRVVFFIDGKPVGDGEIGGDLSNWSEDFAMALGDEHGGQRAWLGSLHLVAIYDRALSPDEVERHFQLGAEAPAAPDDESRLVASAEAVNRELFEHKIAALLSEHCLECHDASTREGKLDLSRHDPKHYAEGMIVAGNATDSLLWEVVESDEMPEDRDPLSDEEKQLLKTWIDGGAEWTLERIDPALYVRSTESQPVWVRRLTRDEYIETVRAAVAVDIGARARENLPADLRADGFSNTAYNLGIDLGHIEGYAALAEAIVAEMDVMEFARRFEKSTSVADDKAMVKLVEGMGRHLLRGPLSEREVFAFRGIMTTVASAGGDYEEAVAYVVEAMLQSPRFLYRIENQRAGGDGWAVDGFELASRLSYLVWGGPPDEELLKRADAGQLGSEEAVREQMKRMLDDPRAVRQSLRFAADWLDLGRLDNLRPDAERFPGWTAELAADMRAETLAFFEEVVWKQSRPLADLLNAEIGYVTPRLASHYRLPAAAHPVDGTPSDHLQKVSLQGVTGRGGLLTHGSVLTIGGDDASMVTRGLFVFHDLLRGVVKNPPADLDTTPVPSSPGLSHRVIAERRIADNNCGGCHAKFEPLAFGLEKFDGLGSWFEQDMHGNELREDGEVLIPGAAEPVRYESVDELMDLLAGSDRVALSLTWKAVQFGLGRQLTAEDAPIIDELHRRAVEADGGSWVAVLTELAASDLIRRSRAPVDGE